MFKHEDIRTKGSGNIGGTNVWRVYGRWYALPVIVLDTAKGFVPALAGTLGHSHLVGVLAGSAAMLGHWRPLFMGFKRGGKIVATTGGALLGVAPVAGGIEAGVWALVFFTTRYASLASIVSGLSLPVLVAVLGYPWPVIVFASAAAVAIVVLHRANIRRLLAGKENRATLRLRRPKSPAGPSSTPAG